MEMNVLTPQEACYWAIQTAMLGTEVNARGMATKEVQNYTTHIIHPHLPVYLPDREARQFIGAVEALQLVGQLAAPDTVMRGSKSMAQYADEGIFHGAYGQRVYGQLARAHSLLVKDHGTRQAVVSIYHGPNDLERFVADVPCTLTIQFLWQGPRLGMRVSMRSNDVWLGLPYDLFQFTSLQCAMADALDVEPGEYCHTVGSLHLYLNDIDKARELRSVPQPESHEFIYRPRWGAVGGGIAEISRRARAILAGRPVDDPTEYEQSLAAAVSVGL